MDVKIAPTRNVKVLGLDKRSTKDLAWCAATYGMNRLYWINGYLLCLEVYEKSLEHEMKTNEFPISHVCYTEFPRYEKIYEVDKSFQIPIVDVSDMEIFKALLKAIFDHEKNRPKETAKKTS